jgi:hypothetical protein
VDRGSVLPEYLLPVHQDSASDARRGEVHLHGGTNLVPRPVNIELLATFGTEPSRRPVAMSTALVRAGPCVGPHSAVVEGGTEIVANHTWNPVDEFAVNQQLGDEEMVPDVNLMPAPPHSPCVEDHDAAFHSTSEWTAEATGERPQALPPSILPDVGRSGHSKAEPSLECATPPRGEVCRFRRCARVPAESDNSG